MAFRLPAPPRPPGPGPAAGTGPVVVFLPAHDEEATLADVGARAPDNVAGSRVEWPVGGVAARVPDMVAGRRVECLVVDDGSADRTAERATGAGATVLSVPVNRG